MTKKPITLCLAAGVTAAFAFAQGFGPRDGGGTPPDPQTMIARRVNFLATMLNLTDAQKAKATSIFTDAVTAGQSARSSMQSTRQSLADAIKKNDTAAIDRLAMTAGTTSGQLLAIEAKADAAFYAILTADQRTKYDAMPHRGPGGPRGPMMGHQGAGRRRAP